MKTSTRFFNSSALASAAVLSIVCSPLTAHAKPDWLQVQGQVGVQYIDENERTLSEGRDHSLSEQAQITVRARPDEDLTGYVQARALNVNGSAGFEDDTGRTVSQDQAFLEAREFWVKKSNFSGRVPLYVQAGRQRLHEPRSLWWNNNVDMLRVGYDATLFNGFIGLAENMSAYRVGKDNDIQQDEQERLRFLGQASWQYRLDQFIEGRFMVEKDHSGIEPVNAIINASDRDNEDMDAVWLGLRSAGILKPTTEKLTSLHYRADVIGLFGDVDTLTTVAGPGANERTVTGVTRGDLSAWAFEGGLTLHTVFPGQPVFDAGYSYGSGDSNAGGGGTDHAFRQTGLDGSSSRTGLGRSFHKNYGEVLNPELSNLHIITLGAGIPATDSVDVGLTYFNYRLSKDATALRSSGITLPLSGTDKDIGQAVDLAINIDADDQFGMEFAGVRDTDIRFVAGSFFPGSAWNGNEETAAFRLFSEIKFRF